ncbi:hypothetical protein JYK21_07045 [Ralstonia pickettii]|nr:hypothetical protein [Ralstonia pickettii]
MKKCTVIIGALLMGLIFLQACGSGDDTVSQMVDSSDEQRVERLEDVINDSEVIVKGHFGKYIDKDNMVRDHANPDMPSENTYTEGHIYEFHIEEVYKGEVDSTINVMIPYASEIKVYDENAKYVGDVMNESTEYKKPDPEESNILFLNQTGIKENLYGPGSIPYNIVINKDESIEFVSKRIEGQLEDNVIVEGDSEEAYIIHEHRDDVPADVKEEFAVIPDLLNGKTLSDVEELLKKIEQ